MDLTVSLWSDDDATVGGESVLPHEWPMHERMVGARTRRGRPFPPPPRCPSPVSTSVSVGDRQGCHLLPPFPVDRKLEALGLEACVLDWLESGVDAMAKVEVRWWFLPGPLR